MTCMTDWAAWDGVGEEGAMRSIWGPVHRETDPERGASQSVRVSKAPTPAESTRNNPIIPYYFPLSLHMGPPRSHRRGPKAVLPCMFDSFLCPVWLSLRGLGYGY